MKKQKGFVTRNKASSATASDRRASLRRALDAQRKKQKARSDKLGMNLKHKDNHLKAIGEQLECSTELLDNVSSYLQKIGSTMSDPLMVNHPRREEFISAMDQLTKDGREYSAKLEGVEKEIEAFKASEERDPILMTRDSFGICEQLQCERDLMAQRMLSTSLLAQEIVLEENPVSESKVGE